jgi:hypothetical protein
VKFDLNFGALLSSMTSPYVSKSYTNGGTDQQNGTIACGRGGTDMGDKGSKDKGKREQQKKAQLSPKEKRKLKKEKKDTETRVLSK